MAERERQLRTDSFRVRLSPEMMARFTVIAEFYGMPPATMAAFAVGEFVQRKETERRMVSEATQGIGGQLEAFLNTSFGQEAAMKIATATAMQAARAGALDQENLPLGE